MLLLALGYFGAAPSSLEQGGTPPGLSAFLLLDPSSMEKEAAIPGVRMPKGIELDKELKMRGRDWEW